jgi:hypothetical protein
MGDFFNAMSHLGLYTHLLVGAQKSDFIAEFLRAFIREEDISDEKTFSHKPTEEDENSPYLNRQLMIRKIRMSSPGFTDIAGLGEVVGHIKDFSCELINNYRDRPFRAEALKKEKIDTQMRQIQLMQSYIDLAKSAGFNDSETRKLISKFDEIQDTLITLIEKEKITSVKTVTDV